MTRHERPGLAVIFLGPLVPVVVLLLLDVLKLGSWWRVPSWGLGLAFGLWWTLCLVGGAILRFDARGIALDSAYSVVVGGPIAILLFVMHDVVDSRLDPVQAVAAGLGVWACSIALFNSLAPLLRRYVVGRRKPPGAAVNLLGGRTSGRHS